MSFVENFFSGWDMMRVERFVWAHELWDDCEGFSLEYQLLAIQAYLRERARERVEYRRLRGEL